MAAKPRIGIYPGTFDPITNGHLDIIIRSVQVVDQLTVAIAANAGKGPLFGLDERTEMAREEIQAAAGAQAERINVAPFNTLLVDFAVRCKASCIIRGLRAVSDFEYEFQMASMNKRLNQNIETVFLMASERHHFISSRFVKEIARLGGDVASFVSPRVAERIGDRVGGPGLYAVNE